nr:isopenicillin N synthase family oxygenase [Pigmentibacter ruber]
MKQVPITSISEYINGSIKDKNNFVRSFGKAIQEFGFVIVEDHEIENTLINDCYDQAKKLFNLSLQIKKNYSAADGLGQRGYVSFGIEHAKNSDKGDLKEFWHIGREHFANKSIEQMSEKNIWPTNELPQFKNLFLELYSKLDNMALILLSAMSDYLGLEKDSLPKMAKDGNTILRVLHYPPLKNNDFSSGAVRAGEHEDINLMTILCEATEGGLEILTREGKWLEIQTKKGQMVVDSGDMLSRITNQIVPSTTHRVVNPKSAKNVSRYSMPFFIHPYENCELNVFKNCLSPSRPAKFPPILANEFLLQRLKEIGLGNKN